DSASAKSANDAARKNASCSGSRKPPKWNRKPWSHRQKRTLKKQTLKKQTLKKQTLKKRCHRLTPERTTQQTLRAKRQKKTKAAAFPCRFRTRSTWGASCS